MTSLKFSDRLNLKDVETFVFSRERFADIEIGPEQLSQIEKSHRQFLGLLEKNIPIYGVTTGFGDSCFRTLSPDQSEQLQINLVQYLSCGTGPTLSREASRAIMLFRLKSLSRGYSGVSTDLISRLKLFVERDWVPLIPREGSLGASGDLIPLAYVARALQGEGKIHTDSGLRLASEVLRDGDVAPYKLKAKEGLALVNGTSAMCGTTFVNLHHAKNLMALGEVATAWMVLALGGRVEAFSELVNSRANQHPGQAKAAESIRNLLSDEGYNPRAAKDVTIKDGHTTELIQDRYSVRCVPQILGPIQETLEMATKWLEDEVNSTSDNPLIDSEGQIAMGGNFYGGYLAHAMDYIKIGLAHQADLADRQLTLLIDDKSNRGLTPNLADWNSAGEHERHLQHGLKGLHQATSAITSEIMAKAIPNGIFSRSSESHNQDKISLGMSAASQCHDMIEQVYTVMTLHLTCLAQALDLRGITLKGNASTRVYDTVRRQVPFVKRDTALDSHITNLSAELKARNFSEA